MQNGVPLANSLFTQTVVGHAKKHSMKFIAMIMCSIGIACYSQQVADTITHWHLSIDNEIVLRGNALSERGMLPVALIDLSKDFQNIKVDFFYDYYGGALDSKVELFLEDKCIFSHTESTDMQSGTSIPKEKLVDLVREEVLLVKYYDNKYWENGIPIGHIYLKQEKK